MRGISGHASGIHEDDRSAAPYATNLLRGIEATRIRERLLAIPVPGHTRAGVVFVLDYVFTGDSLAWSHERRDLQTFRGACWYSWDEFKLSLARLGGYRFEWVLAGYGGSARLSVDEMRERLCALVESM
jgi:glyoxylase-like metal-dependent hydrolase (beta-lactamase superfamily II)